MGAPVEAHTLVNDQGTTFQRRLDGHEDPAVKSGEAYVFTLPAPNTKPTAHFSSLLLSADVKATCLEVAVLGSLTYVAYHPFHPGWVVDVPGSMRLREFCLYLWAGSVFRRLYNSYLEACFFAFPVYRTQPASEHALKKKQDLCGREVMQLDALVAHDRLTLLTVFTLDVLLYFLLPGFYPAASAAGEGKSWLVRFYEIMVNHYIMSFGMYWLHRSCHVVPWMWKYIHSIHHWANHPLSRTTYQDHWFDNFSNAIIGHTCAQILVPLDYPSFFISRFFRMAESLEKHSGISCWLNLAHQTQRWLPYAQMPHHHDWHHEGHKACNFTFSSLGGVWDCVFGTRQTGRGLEAGSATESSKEDRANYQQTTNHEFFDQPSVVMAPVVAILLATAAKLYSI